ncbi:hypothetical protein KFE94_02470 [bacterium SCSIO 12643]|nr:hypothetical protein KFE94_02470 [bacterium SCSIO 12643]
MIEGTEHIIGSQQFQITSYDEKKAHQYQSTISVLQESSIRNLLEKILNRFSDPHSIYRFKQIELDLGSISPHNLDNELLFKIEEQLIQFFKSNIQSDGNLRKGEKIVLFNEKLEQFEHFLINGFLKWNSSSTYTPQKLLHDLFTEAPESLTELLFRQGKKQEIRKRMILQFPETSLERIVTHVAPNEGEYMISYKQNMLEHHQKTKFVDTSYSTFRNAVWEIILAYLFNASNSYYNRKSFLQFLIQKIALKYNLTYHVLLEIISRGVSLDEDTAQIPEFKKLIIELKKDEEIIASGKDQNEPIDLPKVLKQIDLFLNDRTYSTRALIASSEEFISQIQIVLLRPSLTSKTHISKWFNQPEIISKLIQLLDSKTISTLLELGAPDHLHRINQFWEEIQSKQNEIPTASKVWIQKIELQKPQLILLSLNQKSHDPFLSFLITIQKEISFYSNQLFIFLKETGSFVNPVFQKIIATFLKANAHEVFTSKASDSKKKLISSIIVELKKFTSQNEPFTWSEWIQSNLPIWKKQSKLDITISEILALLQHELIEQFAPLQLADFVSKEIQLQQEFRSESTQKGSNAQSNIHPLILEFIHRELNEISLDPFSIWEVETIALFRKTSIQYKISFQNLISTYLASLSPGRKELRQAIKKLIATQKFQSVVEKEQFQHTQKQYRKILSFVLNFKKWPWWLPQYDYMQFNRDFETLWENSSERKTLLQIILRKSNTQNIAPFFNTYNTHKIWKAIDATAQKTKALFIIHVHQLLIQKFIPISSISSGEVIAFHKLSFQILKDKYSTKKAITSIQEWLKSTIILSNRTTQRIWIRAITSYANTTSGSLKKELLNWIQEVKNEATFSHSQKDVIQLFLSNYYSEDVSKSIPDQLEQITVQKPEIFRQWLQQPEFRTSMIERLSEKDFIHLIQLQWNSPQQQFFHSVFQIYKHLIRHLSSTDAISFKHSFFNSILIQMSSNRTRIWNQTDWSQILAHSALKIATPSTLKIITQVLKEVKNAPPLLIQSIHTQIEENAVSSYVSTLTPELFMDRLKKAKVRNQSLAQQINLQTIFPEHREWLGETSFIQQLTENISEKDLVYQIKQVLDHTQQVRLQIALDFIQRISLTTSEKKKLKLAFFQTILLKLGTGGFTPWKIQNWSALIYHLLQNTLDQAKFNTIILTEKQKLMTSSPSEKDLDFLLQIEKASQSNSIPNASKSPKIEDENYRKLGETQEYEYLDPIFVNYSGIVILAPYLGMLFERLGLLKNNTFIDHDSQSRAVHLLDYAATGSVGKEEHELVVHKVLCGMQIADPIAHITDLTDQEKETIDGLLNAIIQQWTPLNNTSIEGLRASFLIRMGKLEEDENSFHMNVEQKSYDMLLDQIPWNISQIKLSWMEKMLIVEWR